MDVWQDGRIKMYVTQKGLQFRRDRSSLVLSGDYLPLIVEGPKQDCVFAFARRYRGEWGMVIVPRFTTRLVDKNRLPVGKEVWDETHVLLPKGAPTRWVNVITDESVETSAGPNKLALGDALRKLPVGLFVRTND